MVRGLKLPVMQRVVDGRSSSVAKGLSFGLTYSGKGGPFIGNRSRKATELVHAVNKQITARYPGFTYTSLHVVHNGRALVHTDKSNHGPSVAVALGPYAGGKLSVYDDGEGAFETVEAGVWKSFDARRPHLITPFAGDRVAIVAYTHSSAFTSMARQFMDPLLQQGFPLPNEYGLIRSTPTSSVARSTADAESHHHVRTTL